MNGGNTPAFEYIMLTNLSYGTFKGSSLVLYREFGYMIFCRALDSALSHASLDTLADTLSESLAKDTSTPLKTKKDTKDVAIPVTNTMIDIMTTIPSLPFAGVNSCLIGLFFDDSDERSSEYDRDAFIVISF